MFNKVMGIIFIIVGIGGLVISLINGNYFGGIAGCIVFTGAGIFYIRMANKKAKRKAAMEAAGIKEEPKEKPEDYVDSRYNHMGMFKF